MTQRCRHCGKKLWLADADFCSRVCEEAKRPWTRQPAVVDDSAAAPKSEPAPAEGGDRNLEDAAKKRVATDEEFEKARKHVFTKHRELLKNLAKR